MTEATPSTPAPRGRKRYRPAIGPRLKRLLQVVFALFALLSVNALYLLAVRVMEGVTGETYQNWFYLIMFLVHLGLGALFVVPMVVFGLVHLRNARDRPNRRAVRVGYGLFITSLVLLVTGIVLTRIEGVIDVRDPFLRSTAFWLHVATPFVAAWLFVLHRLAGKRINWKIGRRWAYAALVLVGLLIVLQAQDPRQWSVEGPESGEAYFFPSLARTATGDFIPEHVLQNDAYCQRCHQDAHASWSYSVHRFSSFNNPPYLFSVRETRKKSLERDGNVQAARFCAGCHDPVVFFSGKFDDPDFDDVSDPTAHAGITCTVCHAITNINSPRGNSDFTIEEPIHYPFTFSDRPALRSLNEQLVKAKPELHKKTFLKPHHKTAEFCATCHKVHLPEELNNYKFLRGQNHYDSFLLSGVSGHGVSSFYYPPEAQPNCNECHMELVESDDFGADRFDDSGVLKIHDHLFPSANTGIPHLLDFPPWVIERHREFNEGVTRVDIFGIKDGPELSAPLLAPLRPELPTLRPGGRYIVEVVIRTLGLGHELTQGTADSNQLWLELTARSGNRVIGRSGGMDERGDVDAWAHFVNVYMLDRDGNRIDRRNAEDIFVPLYNHQIPPGAADVIHYALRVPEDVDGPIELEARLRYRKFDSTYLRHFQSPDAINDLPVIEMAQDTVALPVAGFEVPSGQDSGIVEWQRWNDYGIGLLRKGGKSKGELRQAEEAFQRVEALGRPDGPLNLARVYFNQGTVEDLAIAALERAASFDPPAPSWTVSWFTGRVNRENGFFDEALENYRAILEADTQEMRDRGFDFSKDYRLLNEMGITLFERAKLERGDARLEQRRSFLERAVTFFKRSLVLDPENVTAHYNLDLLYKQLGQPELAREHLDDYLRYKPDDNARELAVANARRRDPAANAAAEAIVIYDLHRDGALLESTGR